MPEDSLIATALRSTVTDAGRLEIGLIETRIEPPSDDEIVLRIEATPINPSDLGLLFGPADLSTLRAGGTPERPTLTAGVPAWAMPGLAGRLNQAMPVGNEGAGTVVRTGRNAGHLLGARVGVLGGGMYATLRTLPARDVVVLPDDASVADGAAMFVNPLTSLGFIETMRAEGHKAIVHTAAASNLGQMLNRICLADDIPLVNIVRSTAQATLLRDQGARHVLDSTAADFEAQLADAIAETGATLAFDAIGGGTQAARILAAMEAVATRGQTPYSRYGSDMLKRIYIYGALDPAPTVLDRWVGFAWSVGGWLLTPFLARLGTEGVERLRRRIAGELTTTFASHYTATIPLRQVLDPATVRAFTRKATGEKYLIDPSA